MSRRRVITLLLFAIFFSILTPIANAATYQVTNLGTIGDNIFGVRWSYGYGINERGQAVGYSSVNSGGNHGFFWSANTITDIGVIAVGVNGDDSSQAWGVNNYGMVVGSSVYATSTGSGITHAFAWSNGVIRDIGTLGGTVSEANAVNDSNTVVGRSNTSQGETHAFSWSEATGMTDLGTLGGNSSIATAINNVGQIIGYSEDNEGVMRAFISDTSGLSPLDLLATSSRAWGINELGHVVGYSNGRSTITLWKDGSAIDLGNLGVARGEARDINDKGQIVGWSDASPSDSHAFIYEDSIGIQDLNDFIPAGSGWGLDAAYGINEAGQIVGIGKLDGVSRAYLLTPFVVPIPPALWLFASGLIGLVGVARRKAA